MNELRIFNTIPAESDALGVSESFIRKLCQQGLIKFTMCGNRYYIKHESLVEYLENGGDGQD